MKPFPPVQTYCPCGKPEVRCAKCLAVYCNATGHLSANHVCGPKVDPRQMEFGDDEPAPCVLHGDAADWEGLK